MVIILKLYASLVVNLDSKNCFFHQGIEDLAHADQPLREGLIHLSAPHIYGTAIEALELHENAPLSFLNIGSGTGYLSCIVASILGHTSTNYGVEAQLDVIQHCHNSVEKWKQNFRGKLPPLTVLHGSAFNISTDKGEALFRFDRIYVGAAIEKNSLSLFTDLLKDGGILVAPGKSQHAPVSIISFPKF
jgi:protein-L-isoaspartate O-methyltransferase